MCTFYPCLSSFIKAWFHQDFDLAGTSLDDIVEAYKKTAALSDVVALRADIARFLMEHQAGGAKAFEDLFEPEVDPLHFAPSIEGFLSLIDSILSKES